MIRFCHFLPNLAETQFCHGRKCSPEKSTLIKCILYGDLQKVRENEQELDKQKSLAQRKEEEVNNLNSQLDTKKSEAETQLQELNRVRQEYVSELSSWILELSLWILSRIIVSLSTVRDLKL